MKILSKSSDETVEIGERLGKILGGVLYQKSVQGGAMNQTVHGGQVVALYGDLGGGKTQFTKGIAKGLGINDDIISPTFVIRRDYKGEKLNLLHYDFYRFEVPDEELVESLEEGMNPDNVTVIEWAERVEKNLPEDSIKVKFGYINENEREIEINKEV